MRHSCLTALLAASITCAATPAQADSTAHNGWQCTARTSSIDVYYWLTKPNSEPGVTITDSLPTSELTDSQFSYTMAPENQYFTFEVKFSSDYRIVRGAEWIPTESIKLEIGDGTKALAAGTLDRTREFTLINAEALPLVTAISNPATTALVIRLIDYNGQTLANYSVPIAGFQSAGRAAAGMMGKEGTDGIGKDCA